MAAICPLMIPGATTQGKPIEVNAPYDGTLIALVETADSKAVEVALQTADDLFKNRDQWLPAKQRLKILSKVMHLMSSKADQLALEAAREGGKPLVDSKVEVSRAIDGIKICIETLRTQSGKEIPMNINDGSAGRLAFTSHEPIGVVVAISAFNHPLNLIVHQVAPAIAVGCPVIVKPAGSTPLSCMRFVQILREAGLPEEWCQAAVVPDRDDATKLATDSRVAFLSFIGSAAVGWSLRSKLAPGTRCALEHGGVAPVIVSKDADLHTALPLLSKGGFYHAGQVCVSVQRVFAHESIAEELANGLTELAKKLVTGDPTLPETEVGPLITSGETKRIHSWVIEAVEAGAKLLCGGNMISPSCYEPTVLLDPPLDSKVMQQEVFGPVVCVSRFSEIDEAIETANSLPFSFQASVFSRDIDFAMRAYKRLNASAVMVNDHTAFRVDWMPFAGLKHSGMGIGGINYTMHEMQVEKMMVIRSPEL